MAKNGGTAMPLTDEYGHTEANDLELGLYLLVETKVPEMVTSTTDPFLGSVPMTKINWQKLIQNQRMQLLACRRCLLILFLA